MAFRDILDKKNQFFKKYLLFIKFFVVFRFYKQPADKISDHVSNRVSVVVLFFYYL